MSGDSASSSFLKQHKTLGQNEKRAWDRYLASDDQTLALESNLQRREAKFFLVFHKTMEHPLFPRIYIF